MTVDEAETSNVERPELVTISEVELHRLEAERTDALRTCAQLKHEIAALRSAAAPATDPAVLGLVEALKPMVTALRRYETDLFFATMEASVIADDSWRIPFPGYEDETDAAFITVGELRAARSALAKWEASRGQ